MTDRYPGYDVLAKRHTPSWNEQTRRVIDSALAIDPDAALLHRDEWPTVTRSAARIVPQPPDRPPAPVAAMVDAKLAGRCGDGYRDARAAAAARGLATRACRRSTPRRASASAKPFPNSTAASRTRCCRSAARATA